MNPLALPDEGRAAAFFTAYTLVVEWARRLDQNQTGDLTDMITEDCVIEGFPEPIVGKEGLRAWADARAAKVGRRTLHQVTNVLVRDHDADTIRTSCNLVVYVVEPGQEKPAEQFVGECRDELRLGDEGWLFRHRELVVLSA